MPVRISPLNTHFYTYHPARPDDVVTALTEFKGPIFADPTRKVYAALGMTIESLARTPAGEPKRSYLSGGTLVRTFQSIWVKKASNLPRFRSP
jgi:hypothetical protein